MTELQNWNDLGEEQKTSSRKGIPHIIEAITHGVCFESRWLNAKLKGGDATTALPSRNGCN